MNTTSYIEVVRSQIKKFSLMSSESALAIVESLSKKYSNVILTEINTTEDLQNLIERKPDLVFLGVMYITDPDGNTVWLSEQLEGAGIAHTGSPRTSHQLGLHKDQAKQRVIDHGLASAPFRIVNVGQLYSEQEVGLEFPLFVKPLSGGGGSGVDEFSVVRDLDQLNSKIASLHTDDKVNILIEHYLEGREFSVAIIQRQDSDELDAMPLELIAPKDDNGDRMLSNRVKSSNEEQAIAVSNPSEKAMVSDFAIKVFQALGARDYGRIDIRLDKHDAPSFLEVNLIPSLISGYGSFPKALFLNEGIEYDEMISRIAELGFSRAPALV